MKLFKLPLFHYCTKGARWFKTGLIEDCNDSMIKKFLETNKIVAFIKGNYNNPRCGYSNAVVQILQVHGAEDAVFVNILENHELMAKMKIYSDWLTYPQLYINGNLIGGYDILLELHQSGEIIKILGEAGIKSKLSEHFKQ